MSIDLKDITFGYLPNHQILNQCSMSIQEGEIIAVLGQSGSGKSTLLRLISGLETPDEGTMLMDDRTLCSPTRFIEPHQRNIGMVFQDYALFPHLTVEKNIAYGLNKLNKEDREQVVLEMLDLVGLKDKAKDYAHELSGGQQQRVALARSLAASPKLLLLDEPFSNLDEALKDQIRNDLKEILRKQKIACILTTHDKRDAMAIADRIFYLENGYLVKWTENNV